jgi:hypothetical protein
VNDLKRSRNCGRNELAREMARDRPNLLCSSDDYFTVVIHSRPSANVIDRFIN